MSPPSCSSFSCVSCCAVFPEVEADADAEDELRHLARHEEDGQADKGELAATFKDLAGGGFLADG